MHTPFDPLRLRDATFDFQGTLAKQAISERERLMQSLRYARRAPRELFHTLLAAAAGHSQVPFSSLARARDESRLVFFAARVGGGGRIARNKIWKEKNALKRDKGRKN
jgi:hypothetical protein